jgi:hypothetical protein
VLPVMLQPNRGKIINLTGGWGWYRERHIGPRIMLRRRPSFGSLKTCPWNWLAKTSR